MEQHRPLVLDVGELLVYLLDERGERPQLPVLVRALHDLGEHPEDVAGRAGKVELGKGVELDHPRPEEVRGEIDGQRDASVEQVLLPFRPVGARLHLRRDDTGVLHRVEVLRDQLLAEAELLRDAKLVAWGLAELLDDLPPDRVLHRH